MLARGRRPWLQQMFYCSEWPWPIANVYVKS